MQYQDWLNDWLSNYVQPTLKQRTYARYSEIIKQHIVPKLGMLELDELTL